eukprot:7279563-Alexandrium_andersonii.AAC.1
MVVSQGCRQLILWPPRYTGGPRCSPSPAASRAAQGAALYGGRARVQPARCRTRARRRSPPAAALS